MSIRRLTIEIDDSHDQRRQTDLPEEMRLTKIDSKSIQKTSGIPTGDYETEETEEISPVFDEKSPIITGRTLSDLIMEVINNSRAMLVILMFLPYVVYAFKINSFKSLLYPGVFGIFLNLLWFLFPLFKKRPNKN